MGRRNRESLAKSRSCALARNRADVAINVDLEVVSGHCTRWRPYDNACSDGVSSGMTLATPRCVRRVRRMLLALLIAGCPPRANPPSDLELATPLGQSTAPG